MTNLRLSTLIFISIAILVLEAKQCKKSEQCGLRACCVANNQPIGKRKRDLASVLIKPQRDGGHCERIGGLGDACLIAAIEPPEGMEWRCPCRSDLTCLGSGTIEVPLGETGRCGYLKEENFG